jgi:hypothetical protein
VLTVPNPAKPELKIEDFSIRLAAFQASGGAEPLNSEPLNPEPLNPEPLNPEPLNPEPLNPEPLNLVLETLCKPS